jgi:hypothetical protein
MVKEFVYCQPAMINEVAKPGRNYFLITCSPITSNLGTEVVSRTFTFMCMDVIDKTTFNKLQIQSDAEGILNDVVNKIKFAYEDTIGISAVQECTLFEENFGDFCAGCSMTITFETDNTGSCDLPFNE